MRVQALACGPVLRAVRLALLPDGSESLRVISIQVR